MSSPSDNIGDQAKQTVVTDQKDQSEKSNSAVKPKDLDERLIKLLLKLQELRPLLLSNMRTVAVPEPREDGFIGDVHPFELKAWKDANLHTDEKKAREVSTRSSGQKSQAVDNKDLAEINEDEAHKRAIAVLDEFSTKMNEILPPFSIQIYGPIIALLKKFPELENKNFVLENHHFGFRFGNQSLVDIVISRLKGLERYPLKDIKEYLELLVKNFKSLKRELMDALTKKYASTQQAEREIAFLDKLVPELDALLIDAIERINLRIVEKNPPIRINILEELIIKYQMESYFDNLSLQGLRQDFSDAMEILIKLNKRLKDRDAKEVETTGPVKGSDQPAPKDTESARLIKDVEEKAKNILLIIESVLGRFKIEKELRWKKRKEPKPVWTGKPVTDASPRLDVKDNAEHVQSAAEKSKLKPDKPNARETALQKEAQSIDNIDKFVLALRSLREHFDLNQRHHTSLYLDDLNDLCNKYQKEIEGHVGFANILKERKINYNKIQIDEDKLEVLYEIALELSKYYREDINCPREVVSNFLRELHVIIEHRNQVKLGFSTAPSPYAREVTTRLASPSNPYPVTLPREQFELLLRNFLLQDIVLPNSIKQEAKADEYDGRLVPEAALKNFLANHLLLLEFLEKNLESLTSIQRHVLADLEQLNQLKREKFLAKAQVLFPKFKLDLLLAEASLRDYQRKSQQELDKIKANYNLKKKKWESFISYVAKTIISFCRRENFWSSVDSKRIVELKSQGEMTQLYNFLMDRYTKIHNWKRLKVLVELREREKLLKSIGVRLDAYDRLLEGKQELNAEQQSVYDQLNNQFVDMLEPLIMDKIAWLHANNHLTAMQYNINIMRLLPKPGIPNQSMEKLERYVDSIFVQFSGEADSVNLTELKALEERVRQDELSGIPAENVMLLFQGPKSQQEPAMLTLREKGHPKRSDPEPGGNH